MELRVDCAVRRPGEFAVNGLPQANAAALKARASAVGFDACGIARADSTQPPSHLTEWLARGYHADMTWMARTAAVREDVRLKLPGARSVVVVARNYYHPPSPRPSGTGRVARYACGRDYHRVLKKPLIKLARYLGELDPDARSYVCVDSGPVLERTWAARAGLGWIGKNSLVLRRDLGSYFFLGALLTTVELAPDPPMADHCGSCRACIEACPTGAIVAPQVVDSRLCISYQTIENRGAIPEALHAAHSDWVFGCDICQEACPWNRFAQPTTELAFHPRAGVAYPELDQLMKMDTAAFDAWFAGTPVRRSQHGGMVRNARIAAQNRGQAGV